MQFLIKVTDQDPRGQRLLPWLTGGTAGRQATFAPVAKPGTLGAAEILGTVADVSGLTAVIFQIGAWWTARSRQTDNAPPKIAIECNGVKVVLESADPDHLNSIIWAISNAASTDQRKPGNGQEG